VKWGSKCTHREQRTPFKSAISEVQQNVLLSVAEEVQETQTHPEKRPTNKQTNKTSRESHKSVRFCEAFLKGIQRADPNPSHKN
jgi:hypothetical protein